jgi:hypothetical protein
MVVGTLRQRVTLNRFGEQEIRKIRNAALRGLLHTRVVNP